VTAHTEPVTGVRLATGVDELLAGAESRTPMRTGDAKSGSRMERLRIGGEPLVVKLLDVEDCWIMRSTGDLGTRQLAIFRSELLDRLPPCIDHAVVAVAPAPASRGRAGTALLMHDVADHLVPEGGTRIDADQELRFVDAMAALHAAYWGFAGDDALVSLADHYIFLGPATSAVEAERGSQAVVPRLIAAGWGHLDRLSPVTAGLLRGLLDDPSALVLALEATPQTLVHGDWKLGNLGSHPDGRTILLDWDRVSRGPATLDLAWYLAVNCDRLTRSKEELIDLYRERLEAHGVDTAGWFETQLELALIGAFVQLGWNKLGGDAGELAWWDARIAAAAHLVGD
jgi:hypothetical protein